jgi:hypothetical protein
MGPADGQQKTRLLAHLYSNTSPVTETVDRAAVLRDAAAYYENVLTTTLAPDGVANDPRYCTAIRDIVMGLRHMADGAPQAGDAVDHRLDLSEALGLGTGAPWDAIRDRAAELQAAAAPADPASECPQCGDAGACNGGPCPLLAPADRAAVRSAEDGVVLHIPEVTYLDTQVWSVDVGLTVEGLRALRDAADAELRCMTDEAQRAGKGEQLDCRTPETHNWGCGCPTEPPHRGDKVDAWLRARREEYPRGTAEWHTVDGVLDRYRLHADTGTLLTEYVCECRGTADCDCREQQAGEAG